MAQGFTQQWRAIIEFGKSVYNSLYAPLVHTHTVPQGAYGNYAEIDFGTSPVQDGTFTITDTNVSSTSNIMCQVKAVSPSDGRSVDEVVAEVLDLQALPASGSFQLRVESLQGSITGKFVISYVIT